jgi:C1A family cysteine protease
MSPAPRNVSRYGWVRDLPDARDHLYTAPRLATAALPSSVDLRSGMPDVYDQGRIGSCTGNAIAGAVEFDLEKQRNEKFVPSRLFIYYNERAMEGHVASDSGAQIRDGIKSVAQLGVPNETEWPYDDTPADSDGRFPAGCKAVTKPPADVYQQALANRVSSYQRVAQSLDQLRGCLASGYPFVFGFSVYASFESQEVASTGVVSMPQPGEALLGGHAVVGCGYDDSAQRFLVRNSWGTGWGQSGYFTMPYAYLTETSLSSDFWTVRALV